MTKALSKIFGGRPENTKDPNTTTLIPPVEVYENDNQISIFADMPGVESEAAEVQMEKDILTISGNMSINPPKGYEKIVEEFSNTTYKRSFTVGANVDREGIKATLKNGVLKVELPKVAEAQPRKISINAG